jgi:glycosyltransferase involved in cell wall biosynthesis
MAIIPLRAGGGTRIKVLEAFAHGMPVVSTPIGCEGIDAVHDQHLLVADAPDAFAAACHRLLSDSDLARRLGESGWRLAGARYASETAAGRIGEIFSAALTEHLPSDPA